MFGVSELCCWVLLLVGGVFAEDIVIVDTIEEDHNITGVENIDVDTMALDDEAFIKLNSSDYDIDTDYLSEIDHYNMSTVLEMCENSTMLEFMRNSTKHRGLLHGFSEYKVRYFSFTSILKKDDLAQAPAPARLEG